MKIFYICTIYIDYVNTQVSKCLNILISKCINHRYLKKKNTHSLNIECNTRKYKVYKYITYQIIYDITIPINIPLCINPL